MPPIILTTINARYYHTAFGLRYLMANLDEDVRAQTAIREFQVGQMPLQIAEALLAESPSVIGFGVYIWNVGAVTEAARIIKAVRPEITIVLGGPEISHEYESTELFALADFLIRGEGETAFAELSRALLGGERPAKKVMEPQSPEPGGLAHPYDLYSDEDIARRKIFVETSRGCPFRCEFCLSSIEATVREFPLEPFFANMARLIERGALEFIFIDRTVNLNVPRVLAILNFFSERWREGMHLHFEIVPDLLSATLLEAIAGFPTGALHLEVGLQTLNPEVQAAISRRQDIEKTMANLQYLGERTGAWIHADLIIGLPGETWESFAAGFDRLIAFGPQQVQVGVLKRLKGAPIARHTAAHGMAYSAQPPYEILQNRNIDFFQMQRLKRFARYFELYYNSGNFPESLGLLFASRASAFEAFMALSDFIWQRTGRTHELPLLTLARQLYEFLEPTCDGQALAGALNRDYHRLPGRREKLDFIPVAYHSACHVEYINGPA